MNKQDQRLKKILALSKVIDSITVKDLAERLEVSEMTVRRDLEGLRLNNLVHFKHGLILFNKEMISNGDDVPYFVVEQKGIRDAEKDRIAREAAKMVAPGDSIIVDIGTTTSKLLRYLPNNYPITVICFTVNSLTEALKKNFQNLIFAGGIYHANTQVFESIETCELIRRMRAGKAFISAAGVCASLGLTCSNQYEVNIKIACIKSAKTKILMVDSEKLGRVRSSYFGDLTDVDEVITDSQLNDDWIQIFDKTRIKLHIV